MSLVIYVRQLGVQINPDLVFVRLAMVKVKFDQHLDFFLLKDLAQHVEAKDHQLIIHV